MISTAKSAAGAALAPARAVSGEAARELGPAAGDRSATRGDEVAALRRELEQRQEILDALLEGSYDGLCVLAPDGTFLEMNAAFERITGLSRHHWIGRTLEEMRRTPGTARESAALRVLGGSYPASTLVHVRDGEMLLVTANPHFRAGGELRSIVLNVRNITQLNLVKQQLERDRGAAKLSELEEFGRTYLQDRVAKAGLGDLVIKSASMAKIVSMAVQVADFDFTVLLDGETGVGKGMIAALIHRLSRRQGKPFLEVNCGAIPETLVESELFGYEPGAFTGSSRTGKKGFFEAAQGGTIFLDEIGELPKGSQAKLLKILDDRALTRVGGTERRRLDVRVIAATNRNLRELVRQGEFRADLLYRLEVIPISIPPLRERREDLTALVYQLLGRFNAQFGCERVIASEALQRLLADDLPGNARELKNIMARLVLTCPGREIEVAEVERELRRERVEPVGTTASAPSPAAPPAAVGRDAPTAPLTAAAASARSIKAELAGVEREILERYARECRSTYEIALRLGIHQSSVVRKMKKYGIAPCSGH